MSFPAVILADRSGRHYSIMMTAIAIQRTNLEAAMVTTSCAMIVTGSPALDHPIIFVNPAFTVLTGYDVRAGAPR